MDIDVFDPTKGILVEDLVLSLSEAVVGMAAASTVKAAFFAGGFYSTTAV